MKKIFMAFTATSALLFSVHTQAHAQIQDAVASNKTDKKSNEAFSGQNSASVASSANAKSSKMAARAFKDFSKSFKNVPSADWLVTAEGGYVAGFNENEISNKIYYDEKGRWIFSMKSYDESKMPKDIRQMVKSTYYDYKIEAVQEIEAALSIGTFYLVHILDEHSAKTIRITAEGMEVIEDLKH